jgi:hypothetical protein
MTIIRIVHNRDNPYVVLNKTAIWDPDLSLKAVGLWTRCMSRPDNWKFSIKELANKCKEGRKSIDSAIQELIDVGYAVRLEYYEKNENGRFSNGGVEYVFFEFKATEEDKQKALEELKKSFRDCHLGNCRNGNFRKGNLLNTESKPSTEDNDILDVPTEHLARSSAKRSSKPPDSIHFNSETKKWDEIPPDEMQALQQAYPSVNIPQELEKMRQWILSNPRKAKKQWRKFCTIWLTKAQNDLDNRGAYRSTKSDSRANLGGSRRSEYDDLF